MIIENSGQQFATSVKIWGHNSSLRKLFLCNVSIGLPDWGKLCSSLVVCKKLTHLDLSHNILGQSGRQLADSMQSWGFYMEVIKLHKCSLKADASRDILKYLSRCKDLKILNLSGNTVTGCLPSFLSDLNSGLALLRAVKLNECQLNRDDIVHFTGLVKLGKLLSLVRLEQECNSLHKFENELGNCWKVY